MIGHGSAVANHRRADRSPRPTNRAPCARSRLTSPLAFPLAATSSRNRRHCCSAVPPPRSRLGLLARSPLSTGGHPEYRKRGIARALVGNIETRLRKKGHAGSTRLLIPPKDWASGVRRSTNARPIPHSCGPTGIKEHLCRPEKIGGADETATRPSLFISHSVLYDW